MKKKNVAAVLLSTVFAVGASAAMLTACGDGSKVEVVYHLNYGDAGERTVEIPSGSTAVDWKAPREGFKIKGWYTDEACKNKFDFSEKITGETDLYAAWAVNEGKVPVTFDYNYLGSRSPFTVSVDKNGKVAERYAPTAEDINRLGMELNGWYKDENCTEKWDFDSDIASEALTLYAGYSVKNTIPRDDKGNIIYNNVSVNVWIDRGNARDGDVLIQLAKKFNKEYEGRIQVNASYDMDGGQSTYSVRMQSTPQKSVNESTYYSISDIYMMAGIEYSLDDWYRGALQDSV